MKAYGGVYVQIQVFLTFALIGGEWPASRLFRFIPGERALGNWIGGWMDFWAGLDDIEKLKFLILMGVELRALSRPARSRRYTHYATTAHRVRGLLLIM
jgi:hypothetical protein